MIPSQKYIDARLGTVHIRALSTATRFTARWKPDGLHITIPKDTTRKDYERIMSSWIDKLLEIKPAAKNSKYSTGHKFESDEWSYEIVEDARMRSHTVKSEFVGFRDGDRSFREFRISVAQGFDFDEPSGVKCVDKLVLSIAHFMAEKVLIPQAKEEAVRLGIDKQVSAWEVGRGLKRLGCCSAKGRISLSHVLMFMPREQRRATITHELAHLKHFDHSPEFYALWDSYLGYSHTIARDKSAEALRAAGF